MIDVTKLNGSKMTINAEQIEMVEEVPDTVVSLLNGKKIIVKESREEIKKLVISYKKNIMNKDITDV
jgi:flagellar protein FlbD